MIYLDNASTTRPYKNVVTEANRINEQLFYNPSSLHTKAMTVKAEMGKARTIIRNKMNAGAGYNIIFTSGATEANNIAIFQATRFKKKTILITAGEHPSVEGPTKNLKQAGWDIKLINLTKDGQCDVSHLKQLLKDNDVSFVSCILVSNETGAVNNLEEIYKVVKGDNPKILLHADASQAFCKVVVNLKKCPFDMVSISSHKVHGLKGVGALVFNSNINLKPLITGGGQEDGLRSGTENTAGIIAFGAAVESYRDSYFDYVKNLKQTFLSVVKKGVSPLKVNADIKESSPYILSMSIAGVRSEHILRAMENRGVIIANGSACSSKNNHNPTLESIGCTIKEIEGSVRISFSVDNGVDEVSKAAEIFVEEVNKLKNNIAR